MPSKRRSPDRPFCFTGKVVFDFFNNDDEDFKVRSLRSLAKEARKEFNVSCVSVEDHEVENPEAGALVFSLVSVSRENGKNTLDKLLAFLDQKAPARIVSDEISETELGEE